MKKTKIDANIFKGVPRGVPGRDPRDGVGYEKDRVPNAEWMAAENILQDFPYDKNRILIGALEDKLVGIKDDRHIMTIAGSRSGKSVHIANNLIHYAGSMLVIDPKGDLANITARSRDIRLGQKVCILDPFNKTLPWTEPYRFSFNPLSILKLDNPTLLEDAGLIADALVIPSDRGDPHWDETARSFIEGVILHVATKWDLGGARDLVTVYHLLTKDEKQIDDEEKHPLKALIVDMFENAEVLRENDTGENDEEVADAIEAAALEFDDRPKGEKGSVLSSIRRHIKFLSYKSMQDVLQNHDFDLTELKTAPKGMTIYLVLPVGRMGTCNRWFRLFVNLVLEAMEREDKIKPDPPVLICLDEFATLGHMKHIEDAAGHIAGFGVKLWPILQDLGQLKSLYKERWETFMGNAGIVQFFGNSDLTTLEYIQKRLDKTGVDVQKSSQSGKEMIVSVSDVTEYHYLISIEEAARLFSRKEKRQIILLADDRPMILERVEYYDEDSPVFKYFKDNYDITVITK